MAGGNLPFGFAPSGSLTSYTPTLRERATDWMRKTLFSDDRAGQGRAEKVMDVVSMTPFGFGLDVYDAGREAGMGNYGTAGLMLGMAGMPGPGPKGKPFRFRAYHGSPHDFDKFSMDKIGTGEGAQAYGHGLYFAENEGVARGYRDRLSNMDAPLAVWKRPSGEEIDTLDVPGGVILLRNDEVNVPFETLLDRAQGEFARASSVRNPQLREAQTKKAQEALDWLKSNEGVGLFSHPERGHMYEVNIAANPEQFLDWDKPLSEQSEAVKNAFRSMDIADESVWPNITANDAYEMLRVDSMGDDAFLRDQAYRLARRAEAGAGASRMLREAGIPGIKYLDAGSRGAGDGTRNYVVFDDRLIEIVRKYGIAGASAMLGYNLLDGMDPAQAEELKRIEGNQ